MSDETVTFMLRKENGTPNPVSAGLVEAPALPRVGDTLEHQRTGISGRVKRVDFWWPEGDAVAEITVWLAW